ncbi:MAG: hypothetical protein ACTSQH_08795 [Candidatus Hodarchaeales archaeon]
MRLAEKVNSYFKNASVNEQIILKIIGDSPSIMAEEPRIQNFLHINKLNPLNIDLENSVEFRGNQAVLIPVNNMGAATKVRDFINKQAVNLTATVSREKILQDNTEI